MSITLFPTLPTETAINANGFPANGPSEVLLSLKNHLVLATFYQLN